MDTRLVCEDFKVPTDSPPLQVFVRNKYPKNMTRFSADKILLYVHGATYASSSTFDLSLGGLSMMEYLANQGYDVYLVDIRGYGKSDLPQEMFEDPSKNPPLVDTKTAMSDVSRVVDFIMKRRKVEKINLMGFSWGTATVGMYATKNSARVNKLVLYAPKWFRKPGPKKTDILGAYRMVSVESAKERWLAGVPDEKKASLIPQGWFETWAKATFGALSGASIKAPNGVQKDDREFWAEGKALYDPSQIAAPTLMVHAEWDNDLPSYMMQECFAKTVNAPYKYSVEIGEGTHTVIMEKNRMQLFRSVLKFLDEESP